MAKHFSCVCVRVCMHVLESIYTNTCLWERGLWAFGGALVWRSENLWSWFCPAVWAWAALWSAGFAHTSAFTHCPLLLYCCGRDTWGMKMQGIAYPWGKEPGDRSRMKRAMVCSDCFPILPRTAFPGDTASSGLGTPRLIKKYSTHLSQVIWWQ